MIENTMTTDFAKTAMNLDAAETNNRAEDLVREDTAAREAKLAKMQAETNALKTFAKNAPVEKSDNKEEKLFREFAESAGKYFREVYGVKKEEK